MKIYLAHPITDYGTSRQAEAITHLARHGWQIESPDQPAHQEGYAANGMAYFEKLAADCDALAFMRFPNGAIGAGVGKEIEAAKQAGRPILEYFQGQAYPVYGDPTPVLSVGDTRATLRQMRDAPPSCVAGHP